MDLNLKGKQAIITGASRGLGFAVAATLADEGVNIILNARNETALKNAASQIKERAGVQVVPIAGDVTLPETPVRLIQAAEEHLGGVDLLLTNAGGPPPGGFDSFSDEDWEKAVQLSFLSHVRLIRAALPVLHRSSAPSILTVTSVSVKQPMPNLILSNSIRSATVGLTKSLALELGPSGIRVNSILPAWTDTERVQSLMDARAKMNNSTIEEETAKLTRESPLGRMGTPQEFANAAVFLLSPAASYITGVMLPVDGGFYKGTL
jgi:3-oxoacyl-[acyl-carrier protein] reductase